jgi:hypothetical protein
LQKAYRSSSKPKALDRKFSWKQLLEAIDEMVVILCDGDITKKNQIEEFSFEEVQPYLKYRCEAIALQKGILELIKQSDKEYKFCQICKKLGKDDCDNCSKEFKEIKWQTNK